MAGAGFPNYFKTLVLPLTVSSTTGVVYKATTPFLHDFNGSGGDGLNLFLGQNAGNFTLGPGGGASTLASENIGLGSTALTSLTTGYRNIAIGSTALRGVTTGFDNVAIGRNAGYLLAGGDSNLAIGTFALHQNVSAAYNVAIGIGSLYNTTATSNVGVGATTLYDNGGGYNNVGIGYRAGYKSGTTLASLISCVFIGANARASTDSLTNAIAIGESAEVGASNTVVLGSTATVQTNLTGDVAAKTTGANGQAVSIKSLTELHTLAAAATSDTTIQIPAGAMVVGVSVRVTTLITGCATLDVGVAGATTRYGTGIALTANTTNATAATDAAPTIYQAAASIRMTATGGGASFTAGVVRVTVHYLQTTAATS